jgi:acyl carrier protein
MWQELLKLERIGIHDDLFKLGAHSLLATQLISRVRRTFQVEVPLRAMFEAPTVAGLAQRIEAAQRQTATQAPALVPVPRTDPMPLSFAQQRLWFFSQLESDGSFYNVPRAVRLRGNLHVEALEWSLNQIAARHEVLRTTFSTVDDQPVQVISPSVQLRLAVTDLRSMPEAERESEAQRLAGEEARTSFDLSQGPLLRPRLLRLADDHHVLLLTMHHIVSDAWSANILFQELEALYSANLEGKPAALPELPVQYADYAFWERNLLTGDGLAAQLAYWRAQLEGAPTLLPLRTDRPRPPAQSFRGAKHTFAIPKEITAQLRQLSQQQGTTLFMTLLAGFQILLAHHSGQRDIVVGTDLANRTRVETERLIGFFINLLPLRTTLPESDMKLSDLLDQVRETALGAYAHQELPFDKLIEELRLERSAAYNPLVQVLFVMQNTPRSPLKLPGIEVGSFGMKIERSKFDFALFMVEAGDGLIGHWVYSTDLFDEATIKGLADLYQAVLAAMPGKHESELGHFFDLLAEAEKQRVASAGQEFEEASKRRLQQIKRRTAN